MRPTPTSRVNNEIYAALGELWYTSEDSPMALLRAESRLLNPWVVAEMTAKLGERRCRILDVGCGAGFLANHLGALGHDVTGLDLSDDALAVAARHDLRHTVHYQRGDALNLPFPNASFDVVCAMDFLEHLETPEQAIAEAARVLRPSGLFFFHTFNRNLLAWLVIIKGVEWFVRNTPSRLHVLRLFLKPTEVDTMCRAHGLGAVELRGVRPCVGRAFWRMLLTGTVPAGFGFRFTRGTRLGFAGCAREGGPG
jgi:2-polyprenyl-6-hydroxyphenyl methylase / 3-demethylubiquinone-9 3-methyltransferase